MNMKLQDDYTPAALYARVSSDRQDVGLSVAAQLRAPSGRYAVRLRLRARGFSRRPPGRQSKKRPTGLPGCLARTRSTGGCRRAPALSGW